MIISGNSNVHTTSPDEKTTVVKSRLAYGPTYVIHEGHGKKKPEPKPLSKPVTFSQVQTEDLKRQKEQLSVNEAYKLKNPKLPDKNVVMHELVDVENWDFLEALEQHPLYKRHGRDRSIKASKILFQNIKPLNGFLKPGQIAYFVYDTPKTKDDLDWWDNTPCTIFFGYVQTKKGYIRELGFNLHYYPPFIRKKIMERIFMMFKKYFLQNFDTPSKARLSGISYKRIVNSLRNAKLDVGLKEYIPVLRKKTRIVPTKYLPAACLTEGNFSRTTIEEIFRYWKNFKN